MVRQAAPHANFVLTAVALPVVHICASEAGVGLLLDLVVDLLVVAVIVGAYGTFGAAAT